MEPLIFKETIWLQGIFFSVLFGVGSLIRGIGTGRRKLIRWAVLAFMVAALIDIPLYYTGLDIVQQLQQGDAGGTPADEYKLELYTTLLILFSLGLASLTVYFIQKWFERVPRFLLIALAVYASIIAGYIGWRLL